MKILWLAFVWPEPDSSAAGYRTDQLLRALQAAGHEVFVSSPCRDNEYKSVLVAAGMVCHSMSPNDATFDSLLQELQPDAVVFDRFVSEEQFGWRVREHSPHAVRILDTIDLHSLRRTREQMVKAGRDPLRLEARDLQSDDALRELSSIYRCDLSLVISSAEIALLTGSYGVPAELLKLARMFYSENFRTPEFRQREHLVMIGNFHHEPNIDSYRVLHQELWQKIRSELEKRRVNGVELHLYGAYPSKHFMALDDPKVGFRVKGRAGNAQEVLSSYRVNLAPLRFGAGIKGKIVDGWSVGTPCVGTEIAAEGMHDGLPFGGIVARDLVDFPGQVAELYSDESRWRDAQTRGFEILRQQYGRQANVVEVIQAMEQLHRNRGSVRERNFVGAMLWHHQHRSTEFFSRWIETKNAVGSK